MDYIALEIEEWDLDDMGFITISDSVDYFGINQEED